MKYEFQIGQRVVAIVDHPAMNKTITRGATGTVKAIASESDLTIGVEWDNEVRGGHCLEDKYLNQRCKKGHGWFVREWEVEPIHEDVDDSGVAADDDFWALIGL